VLVAEKTNAAGGKELEEKPIENDAKFDEDNDSVSTSDAEIANKLAATTTKESIERALTDFGIDSDSSYSSLDTTLNLIDCGQTSNSKLNASVGRAPVKDTANKRRLSQQELPTSLLRKPPRHSPVAMAKARAPTPKKRSPKATAVTTTPARAPATATAMATAALVSPPHCHFKNKDSW